MRGIKTYVKCNVEECQASSHYSYGGSGGLCYKHDYRLKKYGDPLGGGTFVGTPKKFLKAAIANPEETDECILWPFAKNSAGYGHLIWDGRHTLVHRIVCESVNGPAPEDRPIAAHSCGNGHLSCMNPRHLRWATSQENTSDAAEHGTKMFGEKTPWSRLTDSLVREILGSEAPSSVWAKALDVNAGTITAVRRRETWRHVSI